MRIAYVGLLTVGLRATRRTNGAKRSPRGREMPATARWAVGPSGGARDSIDRHADRFQKGDRPPVMLAHIADAALGQDRAIVSQALIRRPVVRGGSRLETRSPPTAAKRRKKSVSSE